MVEDRKDDGLALDTLKNRLLVMEQRPVLYMGEKSITKLSLYLSGYMARDCEMYPQHEQALATWFLRLNEIMADMTGDRRSVSYQTMLLALCDGDEAEAFDGFYRVLRDHQLL